MLHQRTFPSPKGEGFTDPLAGTLNFSEQREFFNTIDPLLPVVL